MTRKRVRFGMIWQGKLHNLLSLTEAKDGVIVSNSIVPIHNYYPKDGKLHATEEPSKKKLYWAKLPPIDSLDKLEIIDSLHLQYLEESLPTLSEEESAKYDIIDADAMGCKIPGMHMDVYAAKPNDDKINHIQMPYCGIKKLVEFPNVSVVVIFSPMKL